jgi:TctA family transporter
VAPVVLGFVLGPLLEENFRRAMLLSRGDLSVLLTRPIAARIIGACALLIAAQHYSYARRVRLVMPPVAEKATGLP